MDSSIFKLAGSVEELGPINNGILRPQYREVSCQKAVQGDAFPSGQQEYRFNCSGATHWVPSKTYMVFDVTLSKPDGSHITANSGIAPNMGLLANLYSSIEMRMGGKVVQRVSQYLPQVDALLHRSSKSKTWLEQIGEKTNFWADKFDVRENEILCRAFVPGENEENKLDAIEATKFRLIWRTCLPLFHTYGGALPSGDYSLLLNPQSASQYKLNVVETETGTVPAPGDNYQFSVDNVRLMVATVEGPENITNKQYALSLQHIECQANKLLGSGLGQYNFSVSPATTALAVAFQDTRLTAGGISPSKFQVSKNDDPHVGTANSRLGANSLSRLFLQYDGLQRPQPEATPEYVICNPEGSPGVSRMTDRYYETYAETGMIHDDAGPENLAQWQRRGPFYYFNWNRQTNSGATRVQVNCQFNETAPNDFMQKYGNVLLFSVSETSAVVTVRNGEITNVEQIEK